MSDAAGDDTRLMDMVACGSESSAVSTLVMGIQSNAQLLLWSMDGSQKTAEDLAGHVLNNQICLDLALPLTSASFCMSKRLLLLTSVSMWCVLEYEVLEGMEITLPCNFMVLACHTPLQTASLKEPSVHGPLLTEATSPSEYTKEEPVVDAVCGSIGGGRILHGMSTDRPADLSNHILIWTEGGTIQVASLYEDGRYQVDISKQRNRTLVAVHSWRDDHAIAEIHRLSVPHHDASNAVDEIVLSELIASTTSESANLRSVASGKICDIWYPPSVEDEDQKMATEETAICPSLRAHVTCMHLVTGVTTTAVPYLMIQGLSNGNIEYYSLGMYPAPHDPISAGCFPSLAVSIGHKTAVTICREILFTRASSAPPNTSPVHSEHGDDRSDLPILVTGAKDGSIGFWSLEDGHLGESLFMLHPHTGCLFSLFSSVSTRFMFPDSIRQIECPPQQSVVPWASCVATVGNDGVIALVSIEHRKIVRVCAGNPLQTSLQIEWDGIRSAIFHLYRHLNVVCRGFLSCLVHPDTQKAVLIVWDLYHARQDRIFLGEQATEMARLFTEGIEERRAKAQASEESDPHTPISYFSSVSAIRTSSKDFSLQPGPTPDVSLMELEFTGQQTLQKLSDDVFMVLYRVDVCFC